MQFDLRKTRAVSVQDIVIPPAVFERKSEHDCLHCHFGIHKDLAYQVPYLYPKATALAANRTTTLLHAGFGHFYDAA